MPNRLSHETSPYLLQHAGNPVDWYPWGEEAFERARNEDRPVLLSIGYSACHWCHVMAHESFENEDIACLMNENFINIKVDREERPDIDHIYMEAVQAMTGAGGWPLTVFLTPEAKPFYGGTYFPPEDRHGLPGFPRLLRTIADLYRFDRDTIRERTGQLEQALITAEPVTAQPANKTVPDTAYAALQQYFDSQNGGFGTAPKFPHPLALEFLMRFYTRTKEPSALQILELTLEKMARGGIYDQVGGGFHRYATDERWLYPHFEKMLYDNALLAQVYLHAWQITGNGFYTAIAGETLDYVVREMSRPEGGFFSSQDADTEGQEGKYYLWKPQEPVEAAGERVLRYLGVSAGGEFGGKGTLVYNGPAERQAEFLEIRRKLFEKRRTRPEPGRDEKIIVAWNGLMLATLAEAGCILERPDYLAAAEKAAGFFLESMASGEDLKHSFKDRPSQTGGFLDDYANLIEGLLILHQSTLSGRWLEAALKLASGMVEKFYDVSKGMLYDTPAGQKDLIKRPRNDYDGVMPCGPSAAVMSLLKTGLISGNSRYQKIAEGELGLMKAKMESVPLGYGNWLCGLEFSLFSPLEIVVAGDPLLEQTRNLARTVCSAWLPQKVVTGFDPGAPSELSGLPLFKGRGLAGGPPYISAVITPAGRLSATPNS